MMFRKILLTLVICLMWPAVGAAHKVMAIPIPQILSPADNPQMIKKDLPRSLNFVAPRIVGGTTAARNDFPEFTQLFVDGLDGFLYAICGATLLSSNKVLTAAHCTADFHVSRLYALPRFYSFNDNISFSDLIALTTKTEHPYYQQSTYFNNDVSVLTLSRHSNAPTSKLFAGEDQLVGHSATIIGTGVTYEGAVTSPQTLRKVTVPIISNSVCKNVYGNSNITNNMLCAGLTSGGKDSCQGDSGGPLWVYFNGKKAQAGIVSWGEGCARPNFYGVYSRTSALIGFILKYAPGTQVVKDRIVITPALQILLLS